MKLSCKLWTTNKISELLEKPLDLKTHNYKNSSHKLKFLSEIKINVEFHKVKCKQLSSQKNEMLCISEAIKSINQFFSSLMISQFEFKFPIVFSPLVRQRILNQEMYLAPISHALSNSSKLIPSIIEMISKDKTATNTFILLFAKREIKCDYTLNIL